MAACGSLQHIFENPIQDNNPSSLLESLSSSWKKQIKPPDDHHSFTEIFGELHFKETPPTLVSSSSSYSSSSLSPAFSIDPIQPQNNNVHDHDKHGPTGPFSVNEYPGSYHKRSESFSSMNSESLQLCTEGLGCESLDNNEDLKIEFHNENDITNYDSNNMIDKERYHSNKSCCNYYGMRPKVGMRGQSNYQYRNRINGRTFPPPISCLGNTGKPQVCFQSYRQDGRFVLKEIRIPSQETLHASREDGRLRLCFIQPSEVEDNDSIEDDDDDDDDAWEDEGGDLGGVGRIDEEEEGVKQENPEEEIEIRGGHLGDI